MFANRRVLSIVRPSSLDTKVTARIHGDLHSCPVVFAEQLGLHGNDQRAWNLKSWAALLIPIDPAYCDEHVAEKRRLLKMEFRAFLDVFVHIPCQILRHARSTVRRLLNWSDFTPAFFRLF